ncbi:hypothetical protein FOXG_14082 [Fusarium oxysporum f. sp. lycopersici 4287]|nr:hypothetical protein FOXG_14082 [Fusarium oxysporum f. sp. lycopersici 4287]KNB15597.1 hypothetical protein FOXG_14082 [Fusarium oxysporum f. sp. lycopersici 4287]
MHANPLYESSVYNYDAKSMILWNSINPMLDSTYSWSGFDFTTEYASPLSIPTHIVTEELSAPQVHSYLPLAAEYPNPQQNHDPEDLSICKPARRRAEEQKTVYSLSHKEWQQRQSFNRTEQQSR